MKMAKRLFCLSLAIMMIFSLTACKKGGTSSELSEEIEYVYQYESAPEDSGEQSDTQGSNAQSTQSAQTSGATTTTSTTTKPGTTGSDFDKMAEKFRGTKVVLATWRDPNIDEDGPVIKAFEKKYGIDVEIDTIGQGAYARDIAARIKAGKSPDIYFCTATFPSGLECLQPIDVAKLDLSDPIWDKTMLEKSKVNGKSYLVNTVGNIWNEVTCLYYNKKIFRENNITTPEEYYKAGKWNFETFEKAMREVKAASKDYVGAYIDFNALLGSTNSSYWKWQGGKFSNGVDEKFGDVVTKLSSWHNDGLIRKIGDQTMTADFKNGKCGMAIIDAWGLKRTGYWRNMNFEDIGFTYVPDMDSKNKAVSTGIYRGWGICKGAKNPVAAGLFLRYYLDVNNYDTGSAFITPEAESFFFKLTSSKSIKDKNYFFIGGSDGLPTATSHKKIIGIANGAPGQVKSGLSALKNTINSDIKDLNNFIAKQK